MSACPLSIRRAPSISALADEEQAVERVVLSSNRPKCRAICCVLLPQSWVFMQPRCSSLSKKLP